jgi:short subunit dehydrogenase-like uncharacterized protein
MAAAASAAAQRPYQVVVWGASGFTGRLVCEHIAQAYQVRGLAAGPFREGERALVAAVEKHISTLPKASPPASRMGLTHARSRTQGKIRWAMAGRDAKKLEQIKQDLVKINPDCQVLAACPPPSCRQGGPRCHTRSPPLIGLQAVPVLLADANDLPSLKQLAGQTQCIVSTAGPFARCAQRRAGPCPALPRTWPPGLQIGRRAQPRLGAARPTPAAPAHRFGSNMVEASVTEGTHYCDITGGSVGLSLRCPGQAQRDPCCPARRARPGLAASLLAPPAPPPEALLARACSS